MDQEESAAALEAENARLREELERLRESERMYRHSAEIGMRLVWTTDPDGKVLALSRLFRRLTGVQDPEQLKDVWSQAVHPADRDRILEEWARCRTGGEAFRAEFRALLADGTVRTALSRATPWRDGDGRIMRWYGSTEDITDERRAAELRHIAEERLRESEELYRHTLELSQQVVWTASPDGTVDYLSPRFAEMTGVAPGRPPADAIHPDDLARVREVWGESVATGRRHHIEYRVRMADGSYRAVRARAAPRRGPDGAILRWYGTIEDIEEQKQRETARLLAEERLRESEELYRFTVELSQQLAWTADPSGRVLSLSPRFYEITGISPEIDPETAWRSILHPAEEQSVYAEWRVAMANGDPHEAEVRVRVADGSYRSFMIRAQPRRDADGTIIRWYGTTEDIHEEKSAERARQAAEERYRLAARATNDVIWDYDLLTGEIQWGDQAAEMFGEPDMPTTTPIGWWTERIHPDERERTERTLSKAADAGWTRWSASYRFRRGDGSYADIFDRGFMIHDEEGRAVRAVGAMTDLTERYRAEAELRRIQAELIHVSRLSAMGTMASTLAHELNQPLTAVANYVRGIRKLLARGAEASEIDAGLEAAEEAALRAGEIIRRLRELVARGEAETATEDLTTLIEEASVLAFVDEHLLGITHRFKPDPAARWVRADRIQVQQVLINLVRNAAQAMCDSPVKEVLVSTRALPDAMVEVRVEDTGPGFAPLLGETLFSPFLTSKSDGMGMGLPISRTIVEAHGGKIWAEEREAGGAAFYFTLPAARPPEGV